ncbi:leucine-rich repeat domain-containing protein [Erysipelotrichaceae bacterium OttesenSCG-928-M19]|nr:leucine-rich repeat domain-containing protein [Erysipelotrichaceae bacterium OttesenSCG-928-M19]
MKKMSLMFLMFFIVFSFDLSAATFKDCGVNDIRKAEIITCSDIKISSYSELANAPKLKQLILKNVGLTKIPEEVINNKNIEYLDLSHNEIRVIPNDISQMKKLSYLDLSNNNLETINNKIGELSSLKQLYLNSNSIYYLPKQITKLSNLNKLNLANNSLNSVISLNDLRNLKYLNLNDNLIININSLAKTNLTTLSINNNLLNVDTIETKNKTFKVIKQQSVKLENKDAIITIENHLYNRSNLIVNSVITSNKKRLVGFKKYSIILVDEKDNILKYDDYFDEKGRVKKNENVYGAIKIDAHDNSKLILKERIAIHISKDRELISTITSNNINTVSGNLIPYVSSEEVKKEKIEKNDISLLSLVEKDQLDYYNILRYYALQIVLLIIIFVPLLIMILFIRKSIIMSEDI